MHTRLLKYLVFGPLVSSRAGGRVGATESGRAAGSLFGTTIKGDDDDDYTNRARSRSQKNRESNKISRCKFQSRYSIRLFLRLAKLPIRFRFCFRFRFRFRSLDSPRFLVLSLLQK